MVVIKREFMSNRINKVGEIVDDVKEGWLLTKELISADYIRPLDYNAKIHKCKNCNKMFVSKDILEGHNCENKQGEELDNE